jgi:hypothetical protein
MPSIWIELPQVGEIALSEHVALYLPAHRGVGA